MTIGTALEGSQRQSWEVVRISARWQELRRRSMLGVRGAPARDCAGGCSQVSLDQQISQLLDGLGVMAQVETQ